MIPATLMSVVEPEHGPIAPPKWVSIDVPEISEQLEDEEVFLCDDCDGLEDDCPCCRGYGLLHGYDSNFLGYPVVLWTRWAPEVDRPHWHAVPQTRPFSMAQGSRAVA